MRGGTAVGVMVALAVALAGLGPGAAVAGASPDVASTDSVGTAVGSAATGPLAGATSAATGPVAGAASAATGPVADAASAEAAAASCSFPYTATDATGTNVTLDAEPERIVTLSPSAAQTLWELGASEKVVGVSDNAGYLDGASELPNVTSGRTILTEKIVSLGPDLVLAPNIIPDEAVTSLRQKGLTVYNAGPTANFSELYDKTERIGRLAGECGAANATVADMRERVTAIRTAVSDEPHPGAMYVFYGYAAGDGTFVDSVLTAAGTTNVAAEMGYSGFKPVQTERVANRTGAIEWLVLNSNPASHPSGPVYNETTALRENQTVVVNEDYLNQPAPRIVWVLENVTRAIHPDAYEEAQAALSATPTPTVTATPTPTVAATDAAVTESGATATTAAPGTGTAELGPSTAEPGSATVTVTATQTTGGGGPGFTTVTALLAVLGTALLGRRL
ncbi:MAG: PGF-CTERM-anchored ABC transporter substrate-binding protein [Haloarculaceae archaeon]